MIWSELTRNGASLFWSALDTTPCLIQIREFSLGETRQYLVEIVDGRINEFRSFGRYHRLEDAKYAASQHASAFAEMRMAPET